jgi:hypothetical protein
MKDLMVDIETLGTQPGSVVVQIGACYFNRYTGEIGDKFLANVDIQSCLDVELVVDAGALKFWFDQFRHAEYNPTWQEQTHKLTRVINDLATFAKPADYAWAHATFDFPLIGAAAKAVGLKMPINYRNCRDIRTLVDLAGLPYEKPRVDKTHDALGDCIYQVGYCVKCFNAIEEKGRGT